MMSFRGTRLENLKLPLAIVWLLETLAKAKGRRQLFERQSPQLLKSLKDIRQESLYQPDINDGGRVNIAPLQKAGLLAADVLAAKDMEKAIADRAAWRDDERRWCREGKLPKPGWWD